MTAADQPMPEAPETLAAQLAWLAAGKRRAVLITWGAALPMLNPRWDVLNTPHGLLVFEPGLTSAADCWQHVVQNTLGDLLGYGVPRKPEGPADECVVIRGPQGEEKQSVVIDAATRDAALAAAHAVKDAADTVTIEPAVQAMTGRLEALPLRAVIGCLEQAGWRLQLKQR